MLTLKESLAEWTDWDVAGYKLARCLGLMSAEVSFNVDAKHVFWAAHPVGEMLWDMLKKLAENGVLEFDEEDDRYRWNHSFKGSWEKA